MEVRISVSFLPAAKMRQLNRTWRGKDYTPSVLSFPYREETEEGMLLGEILISKSEARKLAAKNRVTLGEQINQLLVHGIEGILGAHED